MVWAWDIGAPKGKDATADDHQFTLEMPNVWTIPTYDKELNLVYLPTGNGPPDYWGGDRNAAKEKYGSAVVAVDAPLIYKSPVNGKQYVVISAGGMSHSPDVGDYIIAYALPDSAEK